MTMETIMESIERFKLRAALFLEENTKAFIIDSTDNWHFCYITKISENRIEVLEFSGKNAGRNNIINWVDIMKFEEFRERVE